MPGVAVILGSAFDASSLGIALAPERFETPWGPFTLHRAPSLGDPVVVFRHGSPHTLLPNQIPYRAMAWALREAGVGALLVTSSVGVMDAQVPLYRPLPVSDLLMPENRLPDGSTCTLFDVPRAGQGHLVLTEGLFSRALTAQLAGLARGCGSALGPEVVFAYAGGPRTKTAAENALWARLGAQVNSMTLGPEVVLANEAGIPTAAIVVGHKYSLGGDARPGDREEIGASLVRSRAELQRLVLAFLERGAPVPFANELFRFGT
jgi:5'-methylthioadenosine phosphorylase